MASLQLFKDKLEEIKSSKSFIMNRNLKNKIFEEYREKKLNENTLLLYLYSEENDTIKFNEIDLIELIAIANVLKEYYTIELKKYFTDREIEGYINYIKPIDFDDSNEIIFSDVSRYNDQLYACTAWKPSKMAISKKNKLIRYNFATQRDATISLDKYGNVRRKITISRENVDGIKKYISMGDYFPPDTIHLNIPLIENKNINVMYDEDKRELRIKINYNIDDENYTAVDITDGWHRYTAVYELFNELNEKQKNIDDIFHGFPVQISLTTIEQASEFVYRQTLASIAKTEYVETKIDNKYNKFINKINLLGESKTNILYNNIANTFELMKVENKITYFLLLEKTLKYIEEKEKIDFGSLNEQVYGIKDLQLILNLITIRSAEKDILKYTNIFVGYMAIYSNVRKNSLKEDKIIDITNKVIDYILIDNNINNLKLNQKNTDIKKIYNYFDEIIIGLIKK